MSEAPTTTRFNPVLGFLSVSTPLAISLYGIPDWFQSRAGFSECLDIEHPGEETPDGSFNPVLGFLSVSTHEP